MTSNNPVTTSAAPSLQLQPTIHPTYARMLCAYLYREGFDTTTVLADTRLKWSQLTSDHRPLSFAQMSRLVDKAIQLTGRPWLGMEISNMTTLAMHGPVGYAAISAPDVRAVIDLLARFANVRFNLIGITTHTDEQTCRIQLLEHAPLGSIREFVLAASLSTFMELMDTVLGGGFTPTHIQWPQPRPEWANEYEARLPLPIEFDAAQLEVTLPAVTLDTPVLTADPNTYRSALRDCEAQLRNSTAGGTLSRRVYAYLLRQEGEYPTLDAAADTFAMSRRTLIRRLKDEDTSYQALLDEVRQELTAWCLLETDLPIARIAEIAGYQDTSNFSRTVRRWFGTSPQQMRETQH